MSLLSVRDLQVWFDLPHGGRLHAVQGVRFDLETVSGSAWSASPAAARRPRYSR